MGQFKEKVVDRDSRQVSTGRQWCFVAPKASYQPGNQLRTHHHTNRGITLSSPAKVRKKVREKLLAQNTVCFYCNKGFSRKKLGLPRKDKPGALNMHNRAAPTIEHLEARSIGGTNKQSNYVLAHCLCNALAGNRPVEEKMKLRKVFASIGKELFVVARPGVLLCKHIQQPGQTSP
jgi:hypothetical protein